MKEILFRGKRIDKNEWVYGYYVFDPQEEIHQIYSIRHHASGVEFLVPFGVIGETIGQYTGLTDKNGKKIFEGDIIRVDDTENAVVEYDETSAFYMAVFNQAESDFGSLITQYPNVEIISNLHDDPELLEGE